MSESHNDSVVIIEQVFDGKFQSIRVDEETKKASVIDVIMLIIDCDKNKFGESEEDLGEIISKVDGMLYGLF